MTEEKHYPVYKGLQMPIEFMGIRGRFLVFAAMGIGGSFISFLIVSLIFNQLVGFIVMVGCIITSLLSIYIKQKQGLHSKEICKNILVYHKMFKD